MWQLARVRPRSNQVTARALGHRAGMRGGRPLCQESRIALAIEAVGTTRGSLSRSIAVSSQSRERYVIEQVDVLHEMHDGAGFRL